MVSYRTILIVLAFLVLYPFASGTEGMLLAQQSASNAGRATQTAQQKELTRIKEIRQNKGAFRNEVVTVEGRVTQYVERPGESTSFYFIKGDWGGLIRVRTPRSSPKTGKRYQVTGAVSFGPNVEPYIVEQTRVRTNPPPPPPNGDNEEVRPPWYKRIWVLGIAIGLIVLVALFAIGRQIMSREERLQPAGAPAGETAGTEPAVSGGTRQATSATKSEREEAPETSAPDTPEPAEVTEGKTVKFEAPPSGTLKLMPGRLELVAGEEDVEEVRFFDPGRDEEPEFTFGRKSGPRYTHIQLDSPTVSREHAKITFSEGKPTITNLSTTNPTRVNEVELEERGASARLEDGDLIDMGEVRFRYKER